MQFFVALQPISTSNLSLHPLCLSTIKLFAKNNVQEGRVVESGCRVTATYNMSLNKDCRLRGASAMTVDFGKLGTISGKKYGEPLEDLVCVCGFENALLTGQLIERGDPDRP